MISSIHRLLILASVGAAMSACATVVPPAAVLTMAERVCEARLDLANANSLTSDKEQALHNVTVQVGSATPCLQTAEGQTPYVLFAMPADTGDKTLTVGGYLEPFRILSPSVSILDAQGEVIRRFRADEFLYRNLNYSVLFRPRAGEKFVLVTIDRERVGSDYNAITIGTTTTSSGAVAGSVLGAALVGGGSFTTGHDATVSRTFSYEGAVRVEVNDSDTREDAPAA